MKITTTITFSLPQVIPSIMTSDLHKNNKRHKCCFRPEPERTTHVGLIKLALISALGLYLGATISQKMAAFLEENDLFVPDDDDDD